MAGKNPTRIVIDKAGRLAADLNLFDGSQPTLVYGFTPSQQTTISNVTHCSLSATEPFLPQLLTDLHQRRIQSVLVEGGTTLLNAFLEAGLWDEMRVFRSPVLSGGEGAEAVKAPTVRGRLVSREMVGDDELTCYKP